MAEVLYLGTNQHNNKIESDGRLLKDYLEADSHLTL
jgi:hypothetical protein